MILYTYKGRGLGRGGWLSTLGRRLVDFFLGLEGSFLRVLFKASFSKRFLKIFLGFCEGFGAQNDLQNQFLE